MLYQEQNEKYLKRNNLETENQEGFTRVGRIEYCKRHLMTAKNELMMFKTLHIRIKLQFSKGNVFTLKECPKDM